MRKSLCILYLFVCVLSTYSSNAQSTIDTTVVRSFEAPDFDKIKEAILDENSPYFYPKLFSRYIQNDTTLNLKEYRHLYYGFVFNDNYKPLKVYDYSDSVSIILDKNLDGKMLSPELFKDIESVCSKSLHNEPFTMSFINLLAYIYQMSGDFDKAKLYSYKLKMIREAILSSGVGVSKKYPWYVLFRRDMQDIMNSLRARPSKKIILAMDLEYYHMPIKNGEDRGYYFNTGRMYMVRSEDEDVYNKMDDKKRKFEFNPQYNPKSSQYIKNIKY